MLKTISVPTDALNPQLATLLAWQRSYTRFAKIISAPTDALSPQLATLLARQRSYTRSAETISVPTDAISPQLATLLARQRSYMCSTEIISVPMDALCILTDASGTTPSPDALWGLAISIHLFARRWQHARGLRLVLVLLRPGVGNTLGGYASYWYYFAPALATRLGAAPRIGITLPRRWQYARGLRLVLVFLRPGVGNTLGGYALHWYSFAPVLATCSGATSSNPMLATRSGAALYAVNLSSLLNHLRRSVYYVDFGSTFFGSTPKTLLHVDSGLPRRLRSAAFDNIIATATSTSSPTIIKD
jgi:hypothetical protein